MGRTVTLMIRLGCFWAVTGVFAQVRIVDPTPGSYVSGPYRVVSESEEPDRVVRTKLLVDEQVVVEREGWAPSIDWIFGDEIERHELRVVVVDENGNTQASDLIVTRALSVYVTTTTELLLVTAVVKTRSDKVVTGLGREQFRVTENGRVLPVETFYDERLPLDMVVMLDTSSSLKVKGIHILKQAAATFVGALEPEDRVNLYEIKKTPIQLMDFTSDRKSLVQYIESLEPIGETALFDSLDRGLEDLKGRKRGRRALILFTDGRDSIYEEPSDKARLMRKAIIKAQNLEVTLFTIGLGKRIHSAALERMALDTGGRFYFADRIDRLPKIFNEILLDLKYQYVLGVKPFGGSGFHSLDVRVKKRGAVVYARKGFSRQ